ncbi:F420-dependent glucose-6-phosphate dehydrogenase [Streptomyces glaucescens]
MTQRLRLGTLVTSPNFRHPVTLAKELISLDDISGGRITLGVGAGGTGFYQRMALARSPGSLRERADRFAEFVPLLNSLTQDSVSYEGDFYSAHQARNIPGCVQRPRAALRRRCHRPARAEARRPVRAGLGDHGRPEDCTRPARPSSRFRPFAGRSRSSRTRAR